MPIFFYYTPKTPRKPPHTFVASFSTCAPAVRAENISVSSLTAALVTALETKMHHATKGVGQGGRLFMRFRVQRHSARNGFFCLLGHP